MSNHPYTKSGRLNDVLALVQVLAFDRYAHRRESGIINKELGPPISSEGWITLAKAHPELFRVSDEEKSPLSLVARHVTPHDKDGKTPPLDPQFTQVLIKTAIDLHDRQVAAAERWKQYVLPLLPALIGGVAAVLVTLLTLHFSGSAKTGRFVPTKENGGLILLDTATGQLCRAEGSKVNIDNSFLSNCHDIH
jgi:hypothetical protein